MCKTVSPSKLIRVLFKEISVINCLYCSIVINSPRRRLFEVWQDTQDKGVLIKGVILQEQERLHREASEARAERTRTEGALAGKTAANNTT